MMLTLIPSASSYIKGVDVSSPVSASQFQCLKSSGYEFVVCVAALRPP